MPYKWLCVRLPLFVCVLSGVCVPSLLTPSTGTANMDLLVLWRREESHFGVDCICCGKDHKCYWSTLYRLMVESLICNSGDCVRECSLYFPHNTYPL